jgi:hypothetical protein
MLFEYTCSWMRSEQCDKKQSSLKLPHTNSYYNIAFECKLSRHTGSETMTEEVYIRVGNK